MRTMHNTLQAALYLFQRCWVMSVGGPQTIAVSRVCSECITGENGGYGRGVNTGQQFDQNSRLSSVAIYMIEGMNNGAALEATFAHELGHTFGLVHCDVSATTNGQKNGPPLYNCSQTVMAEIS